MPKKIKKVKKPKVKPAKKNAKVSKTVAPLVIYNTRQPCCDNKDKSGSGYTQPIGLADRHLDVIADKLVSTIKPPIAKTMEYFINGLLPLASSIPIQTYNRNNNRGKLYDDAIPKPTMGPMDAYLSRTPKPKDISTPKSTPYQKQTTPHFEMMSQYKRNDSDFSHDNRPPSAKATSFPYQSEEEGYVTEIEVPVKPKRQRAKNRPKEVIAAEKAEKAAKAAERERQKQLKEQKINQETD